MGLSVGLPEVVVVPDVVVATGDRLGDSVGLSVGSPESTVVVVVTGDRVGDSVGSLVSVVVVVTGDRVGDSEGLSEGGSVGSITFFKRKL